MKLIRQNVTIEFTDFEYKILRRIASLDCSVPALFNGSEREEVKRLLTRFQTLLENDN